MTSVNDKLKFPSFLSILIVRYKPIQSAFRRRNGKCYVSRLLSMFTCFSPSKSV